VGGGGIACPVEYTNISGPCDLLQQDCPTGNSCVPQGAGATGTTACTPAGGLADQGEPCSSHEDCQDGLHCMLDRCTAFCCPATDEPCLHGCDLQVDYGAGAYAMVCSTEVGSCLFQDMCPEGTDCHISDANAGLTVCDQPSATSSPEGGPCQFRNDCGDSQTCNQSPPDDGICRHLCDVANWQGLQPALGGCLPGRTCNEIMLPAFPGVGICLPP
jgi:hypothetical protein